MWVADGGLLYAQQPGALRAGAAQRRGASVALERRYGVLPAATARPRPAAQPLPLQPQQLQVSNLFSLVTYYRHSIVVANSLLSTG